MNRSGLAAVMVVALAGTAGANAGSPIYGGQRAGEPAGMAHIAIGHEDLVIDLRPLAQGGRVAVAATYQLDNRGPAEHLDLVFASGAEELVDFRVTLDEQLVPSQLVSGAELPETWQPPKATPLPDGDELAFDLRDAHGTAGFQLDVPPGRHVLAISYRAEAMTHHARAPTVRRQFAYVLSPARTWAGFGGLEATVHVPPGWDATLMPQMTRTGDTFKATYASLPADNIALTVSAPLGAYRIVAAAGWVLFALVTLAGGLLVWRAARWLERRRARSIIAHSRFLPALALSALWAAAVVAAGVFAVAGPDLALPAGQADHWGYGDLGVILLVLLFALVLLPFGIWLGLRATRPAAPAEP